MEGEGRGEIDEVQDGAKQRNPTDEQLFTRRRCQQEGASRRQHQHWNTCTVNPCQKKRASLPEQNVYEIPGLFFGHLKKLKVQNTQS